jgi:hypothetical protein
MRLFAADVIKPSTKLIETLNDLCLAMLDCVIFGSDRKVLEAKDIAELAKKTTV